jgi:hypothetical protein
MKSLINALYGELLNHNEVHPLGPDYFLDWTILAAKNSDVNSINAEILSPFHGNKLTYTSADSVTDKEYEYLPAEFLHSLDPSGFPSMSISQQNSCICLIHWVSTSQAGIKERSSTDAISQLESCTGAL